MWSEFVELPREYDWPLLIFVGELLKAIKEMPNTTDVDRRAQEEVWRQGIREFERVEQ